MQFAVAANVIGVVIASSPPFNPAANAAPCKAAVPELKLTACLAPTYAANASSNSAIFGPVVSQSERKTSTTAWTSSSSIVCRPYGRRVFLTGAPPFTARSGVAGTLLIKESFFESSLSPRWNFFETNKIDQLLGTEPLGIGIASVPEPLR